jgi:tripartite-type tricarboxylate transporter receptor subunit TctC
MRFVWVTARPETLERAPEVGYDGMSREQTMQYAVPNVSMPLEGGEDFTFDKEFFFIYHSETPQEIIDQVEQGLQQVFEEGKLQEQMLNAFFIPNYLPVDKARAHLEAKNATYGEIISALTGN